MSLKKRNIMKRTIITLAVFIIATKTAMSQDFSFGLKAGANFTKITGTSFKDEFNLSYQAGAFMEIAINKKIGIQPEFLFSQSKGTTVAAGGILTATNSNYELNYINIPLLLRYKIGKILVLNLGPQYSILLNNDNTLLGNSKDAFKNGDFAMVGGVQLGFKYLRFYARYNIGLNNVNDISNSDTWKSQQIQAGVGFRF